MVFREEPPNLRYTQELYPVCVFTLFVLGLAREQSKGSYFMAAKRKDSPLPYTVVVEPFEPQTHIETVLRKRRKRSILKLGRQGRTSAKEKTKNITIHNFQTILEGSDPDIKVQLRRLKPTPEKAEEIAKAVAKAKFYSR